MASRSRFLLATRPSPRLITPMRLLPQTRSCFACGETNPIGMKLRIETDGHIVRTRFVPRGEHVGLKQTVHGGIVSTLLDEMMAWACAVQTRRFTFCAELNVRFLRPLRPAEAIIAQGELITNRRDRLYEAKAELRNQQGIVLATATGKYLPVKHTEATDMASDLVGDLRVLLGS